MFGYVIQCTRVNIRLLLLLGKALFPLHELVILKIHSVDLFDRFLLSEGYQVSIQLIFLQVQFDGLFGDFLIDSVPEKILGLSLPWTLLKLLIFHFLFYFTFDYEMAHVGILLFNRSLLSLGHFLLTLVSFHASSIAGRVGILRAEERSSFIYSLLWIVTFTQELCRADLRDLQPLCSGVLLLLTRVEVGLVLDLLRSIGGELIFNVFDI